MKKKYPSNENSTRLFEDAMQGVSPLKQGNYAEPHKKKRVSKIEHTTNSQSLDFCDVEYYLSDAQAHQRILSNEIINHARNGLQPKILKKLRAGKIPIEARLDLHGLTIDQARQTVSHFIFDSQVSFKKCVIIIHGKGSIQSPPILKSMLNHWLKQIPDVLAFSSAQTQHGGTGSVYVLIKNKPI